MPKYMYERLSAQDNSFLVSEQPNVPLHVAAVGIYQLGDLASEAGGVDVRKFKRALEAQLHRIPRYREKLQYVPVEGRPVWVDDAHFNIDYHVRHAALPKPGDVEELKKLTARITTRALDRTRPLWEMWIIEGLSDDRFAIVNKIHHCMVDGSSGADVAQILMSPTPEHEIGTPRPFMPRPAPTSSELALDAAKRLVLSPVEVIGGLGAFARGSSDVAGELGARARAVVDFTKNALAPSSDTPINGPLGPHRRIDWLSLPLDDVKAVRRALGCTVNDVVLATVTGAVRQYLLRRGVSPAGMDFRISAPVSVRRDDEQGRLGNRVSAWILRLPIGESDPLEWVRQVSQETRDLKDSRQALAFDLMMKAAEYAPSSVLALGSRLASGPINMIVTNVPGPQFPLYILGARLLEMHPLVPLLDGTGLGIALFSYDGMLHVGLNADYEMIPDLSAFMAFFAQSFMTLFDAAGLGAPAESEQPVDAAASTLAKTA
ncbi:MAG: wax ester/triacylglycerol synthase family O-acyltransferase [Candidatus Binatia bacterium]|nr:wax ester/triacylglycerol synthase family O-acyltransferase [Candidatus Binatia bacterium]